MNGIQRIAGGGIAAMLLLLSTATVAAEPACLVYTDALGAIKAGNANGLRDARRRMLQDGTCNPADRERIRNALGLLLARQAMAGPAAAREAGLIQASEEGGGPYQVEVLLGDLYAERGDWKAALTKYDNVVKVLQGAGELADKPSTQEMAAVLYKWQTARLFQTGYADPPRERDGRAGTAVVGVIRGQEIVRAAVPVQFISNTADFAAGGEDNAKDIAESMNAAGRRTVLLIGHADETGPGAVGSAERDRYNCQLSEQRVQRVAAVMHAHGYDGDIAMVAMGHRQPFDPPGLDIRTRYAKDPERLKQLDRRVEADLQKTAKDFPDACH